MTSPEWKSQEHASQQTNADESYTTAATQKLTANGIDNIAFVTDPIG